MRIVVDRVWFEMMKKTPEEILKSLEPPGAGIPFFDRLMGRFFVKPWIMGRTPWEVSELQFQKAHEKFKKELALFKEHELTTRVLVPPQQGLEDSSRYWSAAMCARHLVIVEGLVIRLSRHESIQAKADIAAVKPELARNDPSSISEYIAFADSVIERLRAAVDDRDSKVTFSHPWFGPMGAREWMALFSMHTRVHLKQLREIRAGLKSGEA